MQFYKKRWFLLSLHLLLFGISFIPSPISIALVYVWRIGVVLSAINLFLSSVFLSSRFFLIYSLIIILSISSFFIPILFYFAQGSLILFLAIALTDIIILYNRSLNLKAERILPRLFSMGDFNPIKIKISNSFNLGLKIKLIDEIPDQFQKRDFSMKLFIKSKSTETIVYELRPTSRGIYQFHNINIFIQSPIGLISRKIVEKASSSIPVYPSVIQMKKYELIALSRLTTFPGVKKIRKLGNSYEFEQIREYVKGDDYRSINWKATSRKNSLMVNQYEDERSQQIVMVIDKGRSMKMPFEGLSLMDYAINTSLAISNIALKKYDKVGLLSFSDKIGSTVKPESGSKQLRLIIERLYKETERNNEANFELLYQASKQFLKRRSLMFLFTNFESFSSMQRVLPILRRINKHHLLVVIFFENTEIKDFANKEAGNTEEIYNKTIAMKFVEEKQLIVQELRQYGIQTILSRPEDLSINSVNKYLELKAKRMI